MSRITNRQRLYLAAVGYLALWVGIWCYLDPALSDNGIPWRLPPLCATFMGSMYLSGTVAMLAGIASKRWADIRAILPMIAIWNGGLTIVSLFYLPAFDFTRTQVQVWFIAYISYPLIAFAFLWHHRSEARDHAPGEPRLPGWVKRLLRAQGSLMIVLALALLSAPHLMQSVWAWRTGILMLQLYSMPLLAYGVGSWLLAQQHTWSEIRPGVIAIAVFSGLELAAGVRFRSALDGPSLSVVLWLAWLSVTMGVYGLWAVIALRRAPLSIPPLARLQSAVHWRFTAEEKV